jgi:hypothetical protein
MKLPIPLFLYLVALGIAGLAGWTVYEMLPLWKESVRVAATKKGQDEGVEGISRGKGQGPVAVDWQYGSSTAAWWAGFREVNLIGKLPPPPPDVVVQPEEVVAPKEPVRPLEEIIEIVSVVYDGQAQGKGGNTHVIVRYQPDANVQPPEWYIRENTPPVAAGAASAAPRDVAPAASRVSGRPGTQQPVPPGRPGARPATPIPTAPASSMGQVLQKLWIDDQGDPRRKPYLWPSFSDIKLVRVASDAQSAFFVRVPPPPKEGEQPVEPVEEELLKTSMNLSQDVLKELRRLQGREGEAVSRPAPVADAPRGSWVDVEETTQIGGIRHIGRKEEQRFREQGDQVFEQLNLDTYVSSKGDVRGLQVRNIDAQLANQFGVGQGDVLLEVNGRPVQTKAQAMQLGKSDYQRGVRTFVTKWLANGQVVERTYQAPDR